MNHLSLNFFTLTAIFASLIACQGLYLYESWESIYMVIKIIALLFTIIELILTKIWLVLAIVPISKLHTFRSAIAHYFLLLFAYFSSFLCQRKFVQSTKQIKGTQFNTLMEMLRGNANSVFGQEHRFASIKTVDDFQKMVPISTYDNYRPYVERMLHGEENVLTTANVVKFAVSSGTTGKCKYLPFTDVTEKQWSSEFYMLLIHRHLSFLPVKEFGITYVPNWRYTETGIPIGPVSAQHGKKGQTLMDLLFTTPTVALALMSEPAQSYLHWRFALYDDTIKALSCSFAGTLLVNFEFLQNNWQQLADDIRYGRVTNSHNIPQQVIGDLEKKMPWFFKPNPVRANEIEKACRDNFEGVVKRIWPNFVYVATICTGAQAIYHNRVRWYTGNNIKIVSPFLGASEGIFGVPVNDDQDLKHTYTLLPRMTFFEFIPETEIATEKPEIFLIDQVEIGKRYELVITSQNGFYRYRMGDIVKVVDFYNQCPVVEFCSRIGGILDLRGEKTTEDMLETALNMAVSKWSDFCPGLIDYTATDCLTLQNSGISYDDGNVNTAVSRLYYAIFVELDNVSRSLTEEEVAMFDDALSTVSYPYKSFRAKEAISKPKIFVVRQGTFAGLKELILKANKTVSNQFKCPRYLKRPELIRFLLDAAFK